MKPRGAVGLLGPVSSAAIFLVKVVGTVLSFVLDSLVGVTLVVSSRVV